MGTGHVIAPSDVHRSPTEELALWRERVLQRLLNATAVTAAVAYFPAAWAAMRDGVWPIIVINTVVWGLIVGLARWRRGPFEVRAGAYVGLWFAFSVVLIVMLGPAGAGAVWLLGTPLLATALFGSQGGWRAIAAVAAVALAYFVVLRWVGPTQLPGVPGGGYVLTTWTATAGSVVFLGLLLVGAMGAVLDGMATYAHSVQGANERLEHVLAERERLEATLVATEKARALGSLAAGIAHDLNNLLVPITAAGAAARDAAQDPLQRERLDLVLGAAERAQELARRVLAFSHERVPERHPISVAPLVEDVVQWVRAAAPNTVSLETEIDSRW